MLREQLRFRPHQKGSQPQPGPEAEFLQFGGQVLGVAAEVLARLEPVAQISLKAVVELKHVERQLCSRASWAFSSMSARVISRK